MSHSNFLAAPSLQQACLIYLFRIFRTPLPLGLRWALGWALGRAGIRQEKPFWGLRLGHFAKHKTKPNKVVKKLFKHNDMLLAKVL